MELSYQDKIDFILILIPNHMRKNQVKEKID